jgi:hypothetical protein
MAFQDARAIAKWLNVDPDIAARAEANLTSGTVTLLGLSGWIASGKDSVAPLVLQALGRSRVQHLYYAGPLKDEIDAVISMVTSAHSVDDIDRLARTVVEQTDVPLPQAAYVVGLLWTPTRNIDHGLTARSRTREIRTALQYWGTEVRRHQDVDYWVKKALAPAVESLAAGTSVYFTDVRFPNEVDGIRDFGGFVARLSITRETQRLRLLARDGIEPDPAMLYHHSEITLTDEAEYDLVVDNNGEMTTAVAAITDAVRAYRSMVVI